MVTYLAALTRAVFRTQPKVYGKAFLQKQLRLVAVNFFSQKSHEKVKHKLLVASSELKSTSSEFTSTSCKIKRTS